MRIDKNRKMVGRICSLLSLAAVVTLFSCTLVPENEVPKDFAVEKQELIFNQVSEMLSLTVESGSKWDVAEMPDWIELHTIKRSLYSSFVWEIFFLAKTNNGYNREGVIRFTSDNEVIDIKVKQEGPRGQHIPVESISLSSMTLFLFEGDLITLTAKVSPTDSSDKSITWSSSDPTVATISSNGVVMAKSIGDCIIEAKAESFYARCYITVYSQEDYKSPLSLEILSDGQVYWSKGGRASGIKVVTNNDNLPIEYQVNSQDWVTITPGEHFNVYAGDRVRFRANNPGYGSFVTEQGGYSFYYHTLSIYAKCNIYGNIMSLIDKENFANLSALPGTATFAGLFESGSIVSARRLVLPASIATEGCYAYMFDNCSDLIDMPSLPATAVSARSYESMFSSCKQLTSVSNLPAQTLGPLCYVSMFSGCESITQGPSLPAEELVSGCYQTMFVGCSLLNYIEAFFTSNPNVSGTNYWLNRVSNTGTFVKSNKAEWDVIGVDGVPEGWNIVYK